MATALGTVDLVTSDVAEAAPSRLIALDAVHNFRDLGGYPTADGRTTTWRTLYRADGLYRLTPGDLSVVLELGLHTVIDLRSDAELTSRGRFPHEDHPVAFHHLPVIDATWQEIERPEFDDDADFLLWAYHQMLDQGSPRFAAAIVELGRPGAMPAVFHCAAGKDRTGILAALLLGSLGVPHEHIVADYALTADGMERMRVWAAREFPELAASMAETPSAFLAALPQAMQLLLDDICSGHGSIREFVLHIGVTDADLDGLAANLLS